MGIPIWETIKKTFQKPWQLRGVLTKALLISITLGILIDSTFTNIAQGDYLYYPLYILQLIIYVMIAITCHRVILLGKKSVPKYGINKWSMRETYFSAGFLIVFFLLPELLIYIPGKILLSSTIGSSYVLDHPYLTYIYPTQILFSAVILFTIWIRIGLIFPLIAIDKENNFKALKTSLEKTKNNTFRLFVIWIIFPITLYLPEYFLDYIFVSYQHNNIIIITSNIITLLASYVTTILVISNLSVSYQWLNENN